MIRLPSNYLCLPPSGRQVQQNPQVYTGLCEEETMGHEFELMFKRLANKRKVQERRPPAYVIAEALTKAGRELTLPELKTATGLQESTIRHGLHQAKRAGLIVSQRRGRLLSLYRVKKDQ